MLLSDLCHGTTCLLQQCWSLISVFCCCKLEWMPININVSCADGSSVAVVHLWPHENNTFDSAASFRKWWFGFSTYGSSQKPERTTCGVCAKPHQKVFTTEQNHVWGLMEQGFMLLFCRMNIECIFKGFFKASSLGRNSCETRNVDVNEAGGDGTFRSNRGTTGTLAEAWMVSEATLQTGSDTGEGAQEVRGWAVMFSFSCVPIPSLAMALCQVKGGWREERNQRSQPGSWSKMLTFDLHVWS